MSRPESCRSICSATTDAIRVRSLVGSFPAWPRRHTCELVTNAISHQAGETIMLVLTCSWGQLRVDVHDTSWAMPELVDAPADAESGRGLMLVASLATDWGYYPTLAGKAVYFTLALEAGFP